MMGAIIDRVLFRRLEGRGTAAYIVASLGLLVALQSVAILIYGGNTRVVDAIFPITSYRVFDVAVGIDQTFVVLIAIASSLLLMGFFRFTRLGLQTRAVVSGPDAHQHDRCERVARDHVLLDARRVVRRAGRGAVRAVPRPRRTPPDAAGGRPRSEPRPSAG